MIFESLGLGELGVVAALAIILVKPKEFGKLMREFGKFKRKVSQIQSDVKTQLETLTLEEDAKDKRAKIQGDKSAMREWARERVRALTAADKAAAADALEKRVAEWQSYKNAKAVACFAANLEEIDTEPLLRRILADGKTLLLPYVIQGAGDMGAMAMAPVSDLEKDLAEGAFGIREPVPEARNGGAPEPDLVLVPGLGFDLRGGRLGKGKGFYDRYLAETRALKAGVGFDVQISDKNLTLDAHDQLMDAVVTDKRMVVFSAPRPDAT